MVVLNPHDAERGRTLNDSFKRINEAVESIRESASSVCDAVADVIGESPSMNAYTSVTVTPASASDIDVSHDEDDEDESDHSITIDHPDLQLVRACITNDKEGVRVALARGANMSEPTHSRLCLSSNQVREIVCEDMILDILPEIMYDYPLDFATRFGNTDIMYYLLNQGANVNTAEDSEDYGNSLSIAIGRKDRVSVEILVDYKCVPSAYLAYVTEETRERCINELLWLEVNLSASRYENLKSLFLKADEILRGSDDYVHDDGPKVVSDIFRGLGITKKDEQG